ncbi:MAG: hypothetical protein ABSA03_07635 [Streptosporangiaceae bacterium]
MSSAILYLAIVAIWAGVLVPRWVRKSHHAPGTATEPLSDAAGDLPGDAQPAAASGQQPGEDAAPERGLAVDHGVTFEYGAAFEYGAVRDGAAGQDGAGPGYSAAEYGAVIEYGAALEYSAVSARKAARDDYLPGDDGLVDDGPAGDGDSPSAADGAGDPAAADDDEQRLSVRGRALWSESPGWHPFKSRRDRVRPAISRASAMRARRRMLTMLVTLVIAAAAIVAAQKAPWWVVFPPVGVLGAFLLLLREAAHADAEAAERRADDAARAAAARQGRRESPGARPVSGREPTAEIIDISGRVSDQFYDQYADAAVRAVGD